MHYRTMRGGASVTILLPALVIALALAAYLHYTGKLDLSFLRQWKIEAGNAVNALTGAAGQVQKKTISVDFDSLAGELDENQLVERYRVVELSCYSIKGRYGDMACSAPVALFNHIDTDSVTFYLLRNRLTSLRVVIPADRQSELATRLQERYGPARKLGATDLQTGRPLQGWMLTGGILGLSQAQSGEREAVLVWTASTGAVSGR